MSRLLVPYSVINAFFLFEQKRYSLQAGPPKKDPRSKGVNPAAVKALLKKQQSESKQKGNYDKMKMMEMDGRDLIVMNILCRNYY